MARLLADKVIATSIVLILLVPLPQPTDLVMVVSLVMSVLLVLLNSSDFLLIYLTLMIGD